MRSVDCREVRFDRDQRYDGVVEVGGGGVAVHDLAFSAKLRS
jgi:hypothetical protein